MGSNTLVYIRPGSYGKVGEKATHKEMDVTSRCNRRRGPRGVGVVLTRR